jgi:hypothetical protein
LRDAQDGSVDAAWRTSSWAAQIAPAIITSGAVASPCSLLSTPTAAQPARVRQRFAAISVTPERHIPAKYTFNTCANEFARFGDSPFAPQGDGMSKANAGTGRSRRLGTQLRGEMTALYDARGKGNADLALHYSPKAKRNVQLSGQLQFLHFLYCEIDCLVATADYSPRSAIASLAGDKFAALVDAQVETVDGKVIWHRLIESEPDEAALIGDLRAVVGKGLLAGISALETWTSARLTANPMRLRNSLRAVAWMSAARHWPLAEFKSNALALISKRRSVTFDEVLNLETGPRRALSGAAVLELACTGVIRSDLLEIPLHGLTLFHALGDSDDN